MDESAARLLVRSFLRRLKRGQPEGTYELRDDGIVSAEEYQALAVLSETPLTEGAEIPAPALVRRSAISLNLESLKRSEPSVPDVTMCLDFGTASSKAWASKRDLSETYPAFLTTEAGSGEGLPLVSSLYFGSNGQIYFGEAAIRQSLASDGGQRESTRVRFDNLKRELSEGITGADLDSALLSENLNQTGTALSKGDAIVLYLAYLTDLATTNLGRQQLGWATADAEVRRAICREFGADPSAAEGPSPPMQAVAAMRYLRRRFAMPCFVADRDRWMRQWMHSAILRAQIVADTLSGKWLNLSATDAKLVLDKVREISADGKLPQYLLHSDAGVKEPIAAMAARFGEDGGPDDLDDAVAHARTFMLVIDAGAGTTDFAVFMVAPNADTGLYRYFAIAPTVRANLLAGNAVDERLRHFVERKYNIGGTTSRLVGDDLIFFRAELALRLRRIKEEVFSTGSYRGAVGRDVRIEVTAEEFLRFDEMEALKRDLGDEREKVLGSIGEELLSRLRLSDRSLKLNVMLTGGSSRLPLFRDLASGDVRAAGVRMRLALNDQSPRWLLRRGDEALTTVFPQCAVAIGGTVEHLPEDRGSVPEFPGGSPPPGQLERFQSQGL